jgi:hypothetical protein
LTGNARLRFIRLGLWFEPLGLNDGSGSYRQRTLAILRQRLAWQYKWLFGGIDGSGRTRSVGTAIIEITPRAAIFVTAAVRIAATAATVVAAIRAAIRATIRATICTAIFTLR